MSLRDPLYFADGPTPTAHETTHRYSLATEAKAAYARFRARQALRTHPGQRLSSNGCIACELQDTGRQLQAAAIGGLEDLEKELRHIRAERATREGRSRFKFWDLLNRSSLRSRQRT